MNKLKRSSSSTLADLEESPLPSATLQQVDASVAAFAVKLEKAIHPDAFKLAESAHEAREDVRRRVAAYQLASLRNKIRELETELEVMRRRNSEATDYIVYGGKFA